MKGSGGSRVLMLLENNTYPQDPRVQQEARALVDSGHQVSVICPSNGSQPWHETIDGVHVYRFPAPPAANSFLGYFWEYGYSMFATLVISLFVLFKKGFDVAHLHNPPDTLVLIAALYKLMGKRFVFDQHDLSPELYYARFNNRGNQFVYRVLVFFEKLSCRLADHVITTNESYKRIAMERDGVPEARITIVRNGPDLNRVRLVEPDPDLRHKAKTIIAYAGAMGFQDGLDHLLRALYHLVHDLGRTDFYCVLMGRGAAWSCLQKLAKELALESYIWFTGWLPDTELMRYLSTADICVDPDPSSAYNDRSTTIKMMEYMALGKPIVAFDLPEHRFTAQASATYVRPNDELEFARALAQLMDDPLQRKMMGAFGRRRVETAIAWQHSVPHLLETYSGLTEARRAGRPSLTPTKEKKA